jgi:hypothetical protein
MNVLDAYPWISANFEDVREIQCGARAEAACPIKCHRHARMQFSLGDSGALLIKCWAGCSTLEALRAVGLGWKDCFPGGTVPDDTPRKKTLYPYHDETGRVLYQAVRLEPGYRGADKAFFRRQPHPSGRGWVNDLRGARLVPYRLRELLAAPADAPVYVVAGEKDADTLRDLRFTATTNIGGESARWLDCYSETLARRDVVVIEDRDGAGGRHADEVCGSLMRHARSIRRGCLPAKDATAFVWALRRNDVHSIADLRAFVEGAAEEWPEWTRS